MAARLNKRQAKQTVEHINISKLVNRLQKNALADIDKELMTPSQVNSAKFLLSLKLPVLKAIEYQGEVSVTIPKEINFKVVKANK